MAQKPLILALETSSRMGSVAIAIGEKMLAETTFSGPARHSAEIFPAIQQLLDRFGRKSQEIEHVYISVGPGSFTGLRIATTLAKTIYLANAVKIVAVDTLDVIAANVITGDRGQSPERSRGDRGQSPERERGVKKTDEERETMDDRRATSDEKIAPILDAKRNQFFVAVYQHTRDERRATSPVRNSKTRKISNGASDSIWKKILPDTLMTASLFIEKFAGSDMLVWLLGDGLLYYKDKFKAKGIRFLDQKYWSPRAGKVHLLGWQKALAGQFADPVTLIPNYLRPPEAEEKRN